MESRQILLQGLAGEVFELHGVVAEDVHKLKCIAARHCNLPPICIRFALDGRVLEDDEDLHCVFKNLPEPVTLTLYVSAESLYSNLTSDEQARFAALRDLQLLGKRGDNRAVAAVIASVQDLRQGHTQKKGRLLACALETLSIIAEQGDECTIECAAALLHGDVQLQALACLQQIGRGNPKAIAAVLQLLEATWNTVGSEANVWRAGLECLCILSE
mmetsp:Transcript_51130/g.91858  ORF Transcript_51130/g.91858 Transcript_51130/m.91858 type:complete len:216 (-) Transcript_51130:1613-2260(-)